MRERAAVLLPFVLGVVGVCVLTVQSWRHDAGDAKYQRARARADAAASRASELAMSGIPPLGPLEMLRQDPLTHGARVYGEHCSTCHRLDGAGERDAPDHTGFGSREWILALLRDPRAPRFFGNTKHDGMPSQSRLGDAALVAVTEFVFAQGHEAGDPPYDAALAARGRATFESKCMNCHVFEGDGSFLDEPAPNLTGYGSRAWIRRQIDEPSSDLQYGELHDMPAFAEKLEEHDRDMLVAFLRLQRASPSAPTR